MIRKRNGITLIALVITIVLLIILSTIVINMTFGDNGLIERAEQAKNMTEEVARKEQEGMANATAYINEIIYGSGSSSENPSTNSDEGTNTQEPAVNEEPVINEIEPDTNSVDANTIEPPPVEIPDADGNVQFGEIVWSDGQASITITTDTGYEIEYQKNGTTGSWTEITSGESIDSLNSGDIIYVRLTDGENAGQETSIRITDDTAPQVTVTPGTITSSTIKVEVNAIDNESGMLDEVTYIYYIKKSSQADTAYVNEGSNTNANYTFTGLEQGTSYDIKVEAGSDKAGNKGEGTLLNQSTVSIPGGETGLEEGAILFGTPTWSSGTASVAVSTNETEYTIEYQVSTEEPVDDNWQEIANNGVISGINHGDTVYARLTDGTNHGDYASATITDTINPTVEIVQGEVTGTSITITVNAEDNETGLAEADTYKYYINNEETARETSTSNTYTFTELTAETPYNIEVEVTDKAGNVGTGTISISTTEQKIDAGAISRVPTEYYGAEVTNYEAPHAGVDKWRIYYADDSNIYLIADDYIAGENAPDGQNGSKINDINDNNLYDVWFNDVSQDYTGANEISTKSKGSKWLSQFLEVYGTSTNTNIRAVAYMMDTNVWSEYYAGTNAEYAMAGPTIDMYCASYKDTHPSKYLECGNVNLNGYQVRWNGDSWRNSQSGLMQDDFNGIYIKRSTRASGMWIASPSTEGSTYIMRTWFDGSISATPYDYDEYYGLRPIVCLKSDVQLEKQSDGTFKIIRSESGESTTIADIVGEEQLKDTTTVQDDIGNKVVIPGGFGIAQDSGTSVEDGIVIEDNDGNQFVWIPTGTYKTSDGEKTNELTRRQWGLKDNVQEPVVINGDDVISSYYYGEGDSRSVANDSINNFLNSAKPVVEGGKGGFYIGRYEVGTEQKRTAGTNTLTMPLVQKNKYPYQYVTRDQAKTQSEGMYSGKSEIKATSQLISSYAWDTALNFICQNSEYGYELATTTSSDRGNIGTLSQTLTGEYSADCYSNIYDLLGNSFEWTTEYSTNDSFCVYRSGYIGYRNTFAAYRGNNSLDGSECASFRIQLYL